VNASLSDWFPDSSVDIGAIRGPITQIFFTIQSYLQKLSSSARAELRSSNTSLPQSIHYVRQTFKQTVVTIIASNPRELPVESSSRREHLIESKTAPASSRGISKAATQSKRRCCYITSSIIVHRTVPSTRP